MYVVYLDKKNRIISSPFHTLEMCRICIFDGKVCLYLLNANLSCTHLHIVVALFHTSYTSTHTETHTHTKANTQTHGHLHISTQIRSWIWALYTKLREFSSLIHFYFLKTDLCAWFVRDVCARPFLTTNTFIVGMHVSACTQQPIRKAC